MEWRRLCIKDVEGLEVLSVRVPPEGKPVSSLYAVLAGAGHDGTLQLADEGVTLTQGDRVFAEDRIIFMPSAVNRRLKRIAPDARNRAAIRLKLLHLPKHAQGWILDDDDEVVLHSLACLDRCDSKAEIASLVSSCPPYKVTGSDAVESLTAYLNDFTLLKAKVPVLEIPSQASPQVQASFFLSNSKLAGLISTFLDTRWPRPRLGGQMSDFSAVFHLWNILDLISKEAPQDSQLSTTLSAVNNSSCTSSSTEEQEEVAEGMEVSTELLGVTCSCLEIKSNFDAAVKELHKKKDEPLPAFVYGVLKFLLCFAVAGSKWQVFIRDTMKMELCSVTRFYVMANLFDRAELLLVHLKLYFLLLGMQHALPTSPTRPLPLFRSLQRGNSLIYLSSSGCKKTIRNWSSYQQKFHFLVSFKDIQRVYLECRSPYLIRAIRPPCLENEVYTVCVGPLGGPVVVQSENEVQKLASDLLSALDVLHGRGLVHRDIRMDNVICDYSSTLDFILIDLELVAEPGDVEELFLNGWTETTTTPEKCYTFTSDLHQLGLLLEGTSVALSPLAREFISQLKSHGQHVSARTMQQHEWLVAGDTKRKRKRLGAESVEQKVCTSESSSSLRVL